MNKKIIERLETVARNRIRENKSLTVPKLVKKVCDTLPPEMHINVLDVVKKFVLYRDTYPQDLNVNSDEYPLENTSLYATADVINERMASLNMTSARCVMSLEDPQIIYISGFLNEEFLNGLNPLVDTFMQSEGHTSFLADENETDLSVRESQSAWASTKHDDELAKRLKFVEDLLPTIVLASGRSSRKHVNEDFQIVDYPIGGKYDAHCDEDNFPTGSTHRISTALFYLKTPTAGGGTSFPVAGLTLTPKAGDLILFAYGTKNDMVNPYSLHAGDTVLKGQKRIMTLWTSKA